MECKDRDLVADDIRSEKKEMIQVLQIRNIDLLHRTLNTRTTLLLSYIDRNEISPTASFSSLRNFALAIVMA